MGKFRPGGDFCDARVNEGGYLSAALSARNDHKERQEQGISNVPKTQRRDRHGREDWRQRDCVAGRVDYTGVNGAVNILR